MPRAPRLHVPGGCYHVTLRGNHREALFETPADRSKLDAIVTDALQRFDVRLHAYCWMTNPLHALVQINAQPLGGFVQSVATRFARYRHEALETTGHLFERRYGARLVALDSYFLTALRYIHLNPVTARIATDPAAYPWSSHRAYLGTKRICWVTTELGLSLFGNEPDAARRRYAEFVGGESDGSADALDERAHPNDDRILGDDEFLASLTRPRLAADVPVGLDEIARDVCAAHGVPLDLVRSRTSQHRLTPVRLELLARALSAGAATLTEVAGYLGRDASTLSKQWKLARAAAEKSNNPMTGTS